MLSTHSRFLINCLVAISVEFRPFSRNIKRRCRLSSTDKVKQQVHSLPQKAFLESIIFNPLLPHSHHNVKALTKGSPLITFTSPGALWKSFETNFALVTNMFTVQRSIHGHSLSSSLLWFNCVSQESVFLILHSRKDNIKCEEGEREVEMLSINIH